MFATLGRGPDGTGALATQSANACSHDFWSPWNGSRWTGHQRSVKIAHVIEPDAERRIGVGWLVSAGVVAAGWLAGYFFWGGTSEVTGFGSWFSAGDLAGMLLFGVPVAACAVALRLRGGRTARAIGLALLCATAAGLAYLASLSFFGGFCVDPGDVCVTSWPSRVAALGMAVSIVGAAGWLERSWGTAGSE